MSTFFPKFENFDQDLIKSSSLRLDMLDTNWLHENVPRCSSDRLRFSNFGEFFRDLEFWQITSSATIYLCNSNKCWRSQCKVPALSGSSYWPPLLEQRWPQRAWHASNSRVCIYAAVIRSGERSMIQHLLCCYSNQSTHLLALLNQVWIALLGQA